MSDAGKEKLGPKPIPGMTYDPDAVITGDTPDEPVADDEPGPVDHDDGMLGVEDDDTIGISQDDDDRRFGSVSPRSGRLTDKT